MKISTRIALAACVAIGALAPASATHRWGNYHWAGNGTNLTLTVNKAITSQWTGVVNTAISDWNSSNELTLNPATVSVNARRCSPIGGQILVCNYSYGKRGWLGIATIWLDSRSHITQATTKLNDSYHNSPPYNTTAWRALVACQEIGHDFGLDHQDEAYGPPNLGTCMDYTSDPDGGGAYGPANTAPNAHDYAMLSTIYNHNDGYTTARASAATNFGIREVGRPVPESEAPGDTIPEWGRAVRRDARGRPDMFVKELGSGRRKLTHVFWTLEADGTEAHD
jgi:hypothetical protein